MPSEVIKKPDGTIQYWVKGEIHRLDGPAIQWADGSLEYWVKGKLHRTEGPAIQRADGSFSYYVEGEIHRTDGPAIQWADGTIEYYVKGKLHRTDGPAVQWADGDFQYWVEDKHFTEADFIKHYLEKEAPSKIATFEKLNSILENFSESGKELLRSSLTSRVQEKIQSFWSHLGVE